MTSKRLVEFADACLAEVRMQAEYHAKLANNYRIIASKTRLLKESVQALEETVKRFEIEQAVAEQMSALTESKTQVKEFPKVTTVLLKDSGVDFAEFDT